MRFYHIIHRIISLAAAIVADFARSVLRIDYRHVWLTMRDVSVEAYRKISELRPVYRESYDTHGLSLYGRMSC